MISITENPTTMRSLNFGQKSESEYPQIVRKEEFDWKMVYLARAGNHFDPTNLLYQMDYLLTLIPERVLKSNIAWKLDLSNSKLIVRSVELELFSRVVK